MNLSASPLPGQAEPSADELQSLIAIHQAITRRLDPDVVLQLIADAARRLTSSDQVIVFLLEGDELCIPVVSPADTPAGIVGQRLPLAGSLTELAIQSGNALRVADARRDPHVLAEPSRLALIERAGLQALMIVPLIADNRPLGAISMGHGRPNAFDADDERVVAMLASSAVIGLENARLYRQGQERLHEVEQRRQAAEGLRDILALLNSDQPLDIVLQAVVARAIRLLSADAGALYRLESENAPLTIQIVQGLDVAYTDPTRFSIGQEAIERAVRTRRPESISSSLVADAEDGLAPTPETRSPQARMAERFKAVLAVPLIVQGQIYGGVALYYSCPREFSGEEIELAAALADQAALALESARLREQAQAAAVAEERARLARELHDSVTQSLYSLTLFAEAGQHQTELGHTERMQQHMARIGQTAQQALKEMRLLVYQLRPPMLQQQGLAAALRQRLDAVEGRAGIEAQLVVETGSNLPAHVQEELYWIAQEALNNSLKHANASSVVVRVSADERQVALRVTDNGHGFDPTGTCHPGGLGLTSMRERAGRLKGTLTVTSEPGQGTTVSVEAPL